MPNCICVAARPISRASNVTVGWPIGDAQTDGTALTEVKANLLIRSAGTFSNLSIVLPTNTISTQISVQARLNTANATQLITTTGGTGEFTDAAHSDAVVATDNYCALFSSPAGSGNATMSIVNQSWNSATGNIMKKLMCEGWSGVASSTSYTAICGSNNDVTESKCQLKTEIAGTISNSYLYCGLNTSTSNTPIGMRINGVNGTCGPSVTASVIGPYEDTAHSDAVAVGDLINSYCTRGNNSVFLTLTCYDFATTTGKWILGAMYVGNSASLNPSTTYYNAVGGECFPTDYATENIAKMTSRLAFTAFNMGINWNVNGITGASTVSLRVNGGTSALSVPATNAVGIFEDVAHSVAILATDQINNIVVTGAGGTTAKLGGIWMIGAPTASSGYYLPRNGLGSGGDQMPGIGLMAGGRL
jgi:hypothetical protein